jgi:hypothetical protein
MGPQKPIIELLGSFGEVVNVDGAVLVDAEPPELPAPEECVKIEPHPRGFPPPLMNKLDVHLHPDDALFYEGRPSGKPLVRDWIKMADDEQIDAFGLMLVADAFPPTVFNADLPICRSAEGLGTDAGNDLPCTRITRAKLATTNQLNLFEN